VKAITTQLNARKESIQSLAKTNRNNFGPGTYSRILLELKRTFSLLRLLADGLKDNDVKKAKKTLKLFQKAVEKVSELQEKEGFLKKFIPNTILKKYRTELTKTKREEVQSFFTVMEGRILQTLNKRFEKLAEAGEKISKKEFQSYLKRSQKKIEKILSSPSINVVKMEKLSKRLFDYTFLEKSRGKQDKSLSLEKKENLLDSLNRYFDFESMVEQMDALMAHEKTDKQELKTLEKINIDLENRKSEALNSFQALLKEGGFF